MGFVRETLKFFTNLTCCTALEICDDIINRNSQGNHPEKEASAVVEALNVYKREVWNLPEPFSLRFRSTTNWFGV